MKQALGLVFFFVVLFFAAPSESHFTGKGHLHTLSETTQVFLNPDCHLTDTCDLKRFTLTTSAYETWFSDDPNHPTYGNSAIIEYETDSVAAIEKYAVVQFKRGCVFDRWKNGAGKIDTRMSYTVSSFGEEIVFCFPHWVIDSQDADPAYNSDPQHGRFYLLRWNKPGSYERKSQKYYGEEKPLRPVVYVADYPAGAFVTGSGVKNVALEFKACIYKARDVPTHTQRENVSFATPVACFEWRNVYVYNFATATFETILAELPQWNPPTVLHLHLLLVLLLLFIAVALGASRASQSIWRVPLAALSWTVADRFNLNCFAARRVLRKVHQNARSDTLMAKLRHLALLTKQPEKLAEFYKKVFDLQEMYRTKNGSVHLSDGEVNLAILNANDPKEPENLEHMGMYHFGFHVDNHEEVAKRIQELYPEGAPKKRPSGTSYAETRGMDPDGNLFDISTWGWSGKPLPKDKGGPEQ